jgi:hypothetical protein
VVSIDLRGDAPEASTPEERARQTLDLMRAGYRLKRAALRARRPQASEAEIEALFQRWLDGDDRA